MPNLKNHTDLRFHRWDPRPAKSHRSTQWLVDPLQPLQLEVVFQASAEDTLSYIWIQPLNWTWPTTNGCSKYKRTWAKERGKKWRRSKSVNRCWKISKLSNSAKCNWKGNWSKNRDLMIGSSFRRSVSNPVMSIMLTMIKLPWRRPL